VYRKIENKSVLSSYYCTVQHKDRL